MGVSSTGSLHDMQKVTEVGQPEPPPAAPDSRVNPVPTVVAERNARS
jgi:hypothetical protein